VEKKILIAVDGSPASMLALGYVAMMEAAVIVDLSVTLLHLAHTIPEALRKEMELHPGSFQRLRELEAGHREQGQKVLERARRRLLDLGVDQGRIQLKLRTRQMGLARNILFEGEHGLYDAVVLGRRGLSKMEEMFIGSITNKVVQHADRLPVWVVGGAVNSCRILCAVDSSPGSLKAVDHLAFMLSGNRECKVTLFHAGPGPWSEVAGAAGEERDQASGSTPEDLRSLAGFFEQARDDLLAAGLGEGQISLVTREKAGSPWRAILEEVRRGGYGTVVLGRRGAGRSFWLGHVSDKILARCAEAAVWIVG
jgi:nucleotide-binding universal stress UspA family protein